MLFVEKWWKDTKLPKMVMQLCDVTRWISHQILGNIYLLILFQKFEETQTGGVVGIFLHIGFMFSALLKKCVCRTMAYPNQLFKVNFQWLDKFYEFSTKYGSIGLKYLEIFFVVVLIFKKIPQGGLGPPILANRYERAMRGSVYIFLVLTFKKKSALKLPKTVLICQTSPAS